MAQTIPGFLTLDDVTEGTRIQVTINGEIRTWVLTETNAPRDYDYGGTFTVYNNAGGSSRLVLIPADNVAYQSGRYHSGLYPTVPSNVYDPNDLRTLFWSAILTASID